MTLIWAALAVAILGLVYWLFVTTEGTYLGPRVVTLLYDWYAKRYDVAKNRSFIYEACLIAWPMVEALGGIAHPRVLDVAAGTGRVALALLREHDFAGTVIGGDRSRPMLLEAQAALRGCDIGADLVQLDAGALSFVDGTFDAVTCLEALEFMWDPAQVLRELRRVLKSGGVLLVSNRVGVDAWWYPGRLCGRGRLERELTKLGFEQIRTERWQSHYDLIWARKPL